MSGKLNEIWEVGGQAFTLHVNPGDYFVVDENGQLCLQQENAGVATDSEAVAIPREKGDVVVGVSTREMKLTDRVFDLDPGRMRRPFPKPVVLRRSA